MEYKMSLMRVGLGPLALVVARDTERERQKRDEWREMERETQREA